jgi:DNA-binding helix-hairpin-helix protein with protein kinase domain
MPIERAIQQGRFAFSQNAASLQMTPPPNALRLNHVPVNVASLFERAFRLSSAPEGRPTAQEWMSALVDGRSRSGESDRAARHLHPGRQRWIGDR